MRLQYHAFKKPTPEERERHFLWRVKRRLPPPGIVGVFDRSHYEDVLVVRVHELVPSEMWSRRYGIINRFEEKLVASATRIVKCFLHISREEQKRRLAARLDDPTKLWKYNPADVADRRWYRNWAVTKILTEQLEEMALTWPSPEGWDLEEERARLAADP